MALLEVTRWFPVFSMGSESLVEVHPGDEMKAEALLNFKDFMPSLY